MNVNKRGFLKAGSVLAIISAVFMLMTGGVLMSSVALVNEDFILDTYTEEIGYTRYIDADGSYYIEYFEDEDDLQPQRVEDDEIRLIAKITKVVLIVLSVVTIGLAVAQFVFAILISKNLKKDKSSKKQIITMLVLSILTSTTITAAFMIVALCLKDKPKATLENINEIAENQNVVNLQQKEDNKEE